MGSRSGTDTALGVLAALIERRTVVQSQLAEELGVKSDTIRKYMLELKDHGVPLEREEEGRQVYWSVPEKWGPRGIHLDAADAATIVKQLARLPGGKHRDGLIDKLLKGLTDGAALARRLVVVSTWKVDEGELRWLEHVEDAAAREAVLDIQYYSMARGELAWRKVSVLRVVPTHRFVGRCHRDDRLKWFRIDNIMDARLAPGDVFRATAKAEVDAYIQQSVGGFATPGPVAEQVFVVRDPEARWVEKNLPLGDIATAKVPGGTRVTVRSAALPMVARYVVGLGGAARAQTQALRDAVREMAERVIEAHR